MPQLVDMVDLSQEIETVCTGNTDYYFCSGFAITIQTS